MANPLVPPDFVTDQPVDRQSVRLQWRVVPEADYYEIMGGGSDVVRRVDGTSAVVQGLRPAVQATMSVRSVRGTERSGWNEVEVRPTAPIPLAPEARPVVPLLDLDRQSLQLTLPDASGEDVDCLLRVWWQPSDAGWWASIEVPVNTPAVSSRRMGLNCGLLDHIDWVLAGNLVMRATSTTGAASEIEPDRDSFRDATHEIRWEPRNGG